MDLHLERESIWGKDTDTIEKLFSETEEGFVPSHVIGIQYVESKERIKYLNKLVLKKNQKQKSQVLIVYRYHNPITELQKVSAFWFTLEGLMEERRAFCKVDESGYWFMGFEEVLI